LENVSGSGAKFTEQEGGKLRIRQEEGQEEKEGEDVSFGL